MKNTKALILNTALELFNTEGLSKVTLRTIANKMNISQGNLNYHYKKRKTIIESLYFQLVENIDVAMLKTTSTKIIGLESLFSISEIMMKNFYEYRFFMLDFVQIIRENNTIKTHYSELTTLREQQFLQLFSFLEEKGILRPEILPNEYLYLYKRLQIIGDFWLSSATTSLKLTKNVVKEYSDIINQTIFPYLTNEGKKEYFKLFDYRI